MLKPYSTKLARPVPAEFQQHFLEGGWPRVSHMYGKNPAWRYWRALGGQALSRQRDAFVKRQRRVADTVVSKLQSGAGV